jgi:hypothetical protein
MIAHVVLLRLIDCVCDEQLAELYVTLDALRQIPGVLQLQCGAHDQKSYPGYGDRSQGFTHSLVVMLEDQAALESYDKNAYHGYIKQDIIAPLLDKDPSNPVSPVLAMDFEGVLADSLPVPVVSRSNGFIWTLSSLLTGAAIALVVMNRQQLLTKLGNTRWW